MWCENRGAAALSPPQIRHIRVIGINCVNETATMESGWRGGSSKDLTSPDI